MRHKAWMAMAQSCCLRTWMVSRQVPSSILGLPQSLWKWKCVLHGFLGHLCINCVCEWVTVMRSLCKVPWIEALYKFTIYHFIKPYIARILTPNAVLTIFTDTIVNELPHTHAV